MKYLVTLSALALTLPAVGVAGSHDDKRHDMGQQQKQQSQNPATMQPRAGASETADQRNQRQTGQMEAQDRLTKMGRNHITLEDLKGTAIVNRQDEEIGSVSDVIVDQQGRVAAVIITTGGLMGVGSTTRALSWDDVQVQAKRGETDEYTVTVNMSQQELENLPEFEGTRRTTTAGR